MISSSKLGSKALMGILINIRNKADIKMAIEHLSGDSKIPEETKQKIRKIKEELLELQLLKNKAVSPDIQLKIASVEKKMLANIELYKKHGSENW